MRIRLMGLADGSQHEMSGQYVVSYDATHHWDDGTYDGGALITTPDPNKATLFSFQEAILLWHSGPGCECHGWRSDGKPNRPLTAFHLEIS